LAPPALQPCRIIRGVLPQAKLLKELTPQAAILPLPPYGVLLPAFPPKRGVAGRKADICAPQRGVRRNNVRRRGEASPFLTL
jgi:hypothetical protein